MTMDRYKVASNFRHSPFRYLLADIAKI